MLTRKDAKGRLCPFMSPGPEITKCGAELCPRWEGTDKRPFCTLELEFHRAGMPYPKEQRKRECRTDNGIEHCDECPERFGYCR